jgi:hypothetical protein
MKVESKELTNTKNPKMRGKKKGNKTFGRNNG